MHQNVEFMSSIFNTKSFFFFAFLLQSKVEENFSFGSSLVLKSQSEVLPNGIDWKFALQIKRKFLPCGLLDFCTNK
jgi:hypothetical protein|tara:strand:- start:391 stop:618 length:228 start_codon:yes stop_codon:yes gene_type:complete